jgi:hypothetical protein
LPIWILEHFALTRKGLRLNRNALYALYPQQCSVTSVYSWQTNNTSTNIPGYVSIPNFEY